MVTIEHNQTNTGHINVRYLSQFASPNRKLKYVAVRLKSGHLTTLFQVLSSHCADEHFFRRRLSARRLRSGESLKTTPCCPPQQDGGGGGCSGRAIIETDRITCGPLSFLRLLTENDATVYVTHRNERQQMTTDGARKMYATH